MEEVGTESTLTEMKDVTCDVLVVGAGFAGLAAAADLHKANLQSVVILEARDRIGGRAFTEQICDLPVDLGCGWIEGYTDKQHPMNKLVAECGSLIHPDYDGYDQNWWTVDGEQVAEEDVERVEAEIERLDKQMAQDAKRCRRGADVSLHDWLQAHAPRLDGNAAALLKGLFLQRSDMDYAAIGGMAAMSLGYFEWDDTFGHGDGDALPVGGFVELVDSLASGLPKEWLHLGCAVNIVRWKGEAMVVSYSNSTSSGKIYAKHCIITLPLGVLKARDVIFEPELPKAKAAAVERLGIAVMNRVVLAFSEEWWRDAYGDWMSVNATTRDDTLSKGHQSLQPFQFFANSSFRGAPVISCFACSDAGVSLEALSDIEAVTLAKNALSSAFPKAVLAPVTDFRVTRWLQDPWSRCSYSFVPVGATNSDFATLGQSVGRLHFAGEATHVQYFGTTHGAYLSGQRAAQEVIKNLRPLSVPS